jgi:DNA repair protein RadC
MATLYEFRVRRIGRSFAGETLPAPLTERCSLPEDIARIVRYVLREDPREHFVVFSLAADNRVLGFEIVAIGCATSVEVHPRETFRAAILAGAAAIVIAHNHPSGDPTPSDADRVLTKRMRDAGELLGIPVLDHVVVTDHSYTSFAERNWT